MIARLSTAEARALGDRTAVAFSVPGKPCAKQSVRFTKAGHRYQPSDVLAYRDKIGWYARQAHPTMLDGPIKIEVTARFLLPRSWSKKRQREAFWHTQRPDLDNLTKALLDGLKGVLFKDDAQVVKIDIEKVWCDEIEGLEVVVERALGVPVDIVRRTR